MSPSSLPPISIPLLHFFLLSLDPPFSFPHSHYPLSIQSLPPLSTLASSFAHGSSLCPSYRFGSLHLITLHLLSTLGIPPDDPSSPWSIYFLHSLHTLTFSPPPLWEHHLSTFTISPLHPEPLLKKKSESSHFWVLFRFHVAVLPPLHYPCVHVFCSFFTRLSSRHPCLYCISLHSEFLLLNCSGVEAHRSSSLVLTLLHDSCWRSPSGTQRKKGGRKDIDKESER